jgi:hypothetical protein
MNLIKNLFTPSVAEKRSAKPWKHYERRAQEAEQMGAYDKAKELYQASLQKLKEHFEPTNVESKYYRYKSSEISFHLSRVCNKKS